MLDNCKSALERWGGVNDIIDRWLQERQQALVQYCQLSEQVEELDNESCGKLLRSFCQILVDYVSAGHFEVYDQLVKEGQDFNDENGLKKAGEAYKIVDSTTEELLDFNDKYLEMDDLDTIDTDLSRLGEVLATRFEAEDQMIEILHVAHSQEALQKA